LSLRRTPLNLIYFQVVLSADNIMKFRSSSISVILTAVIATATFAESIRDSATCKSSPDEGDCKNENENSSAPGSEVGNSKRTIRIVSRKELESKNGEDDSKIWLSVIGKVYDVTAGKSFYGKGMSYGAFSATDCTVCFVSGIFTPEEAAKHTDELSDMILPGVLEWADFYRTHDSYKFVGYLVDPRYYDEEGEPTENLIALRKRISSLQK